MDSALVIWFIVTGVLILLSLASILSLKVINKHEAKETYERMIAEMNKVGLNNWPGLTEAENNPLGEYVLSLDYPAKVHEIQEFFKRVMAGDLEFLCKYPFDGTNAYDLIKSTGFQI